MIICETNVVSRGTIRERKSFVEESFERLSDAQLYMQKICIDYRRQMSRQLDDKIKAIDFKDYKYLCVTIDNGNFKPIETKMYYICKRMM